MDKQNFTSLFLKIRDRLRDISIRFLEDDDEVNDALQDMFLKLWSRSDRFQDEKHATGVMVTAIKNLSIDALRHSPSHNTEHVDVLPDVPADDIDSNSTIDDINDIIRRELSPQQQLILYQRDRDGWEFDEIAAFHNLSENNIRVILSRARKKVREIYNKQLWDK